MNENEIQQINSISQVISDLLDGRIPEPINVAGQENNQLRQLTELTNRLAAEITATSRATESLSQGDTSLPVDSNISFALSLKSLQAALKQLTWQTGQIVLWYRWITGWHRRTNFRPQWKMHTQQRDGLRPMPPA